MYSKRVCGNQGLPVGANVKSFPGHSFSAWGRLRKVLKAGPGPGAPPSMTLQGSLLHIHKSDTRINSQQPARPYWSVLL